MPAKAITGDELVQVLSTLANPQRLRVLAALAGGRMYVSELARELSMSRPLLQMHIKKLEMAGLVTSRLELSNDGKAMNFYQLAPFSIVLDAATLTRAATTLSPPSHDAGEPARENR